MVHKVNDNKKINLMILISSYGLGGYEKALKELIDDLDKSLFELSVVLFYPSHKGKKLQADIRHKYFEFLDWEGIQRDVITMKTSFDIFKIVPLINLMKKRQVDGILYFALGIGSFIVPVAAKLAGLKFIIRRAGTSYKGIYPSLFQSMDRYLISKTDMIVLTNTFLQNEFIHELHIDAEKIRVIPTGINLTRFEKVKNIKSIKKKLRLEPASKVIGIIANLTPVKSHEVLLKAVPLILDEFPQTYFLLIGDGPRKAELEHLARNLNIINNIKFLGHCDQVEDIIPVFNVGVLSSKKEVHPLSLIEIMACGIPVVAPRVGGIPNIIQSEKSGIMYSPGDVKGLARGIKRLLGDKTLALQYGRQARLFVHQNFGKDTMIQQYQDLIIDLYNTHE